MSGERGFVRRVAEVILSGAIVFALLAALIALVCEVWLSSQGKVQYESNRGYSNAAQLHLAISGVENHVTYGSVIRGAISLSSIPARFLNPDGTVRYDIAIHSNSFINPKKVIKAGAPPVSGLEVFLKANEVRTGRYLLSASTSVRMKAYAMHKGVLDAIPMNIVLQYDPGALEMIIKSEIYPLLGSVSLNMSIPSPVIASLFLAIMSIWLLSVYNTIFFFMIIKIRQYRWTHYVSTMIAPVLLTFMSKLPTYNPHNHHAIDPISYYVCFVSSMAIVSILIACHAYQYLSSVKYFRLAPLLNFIRRR